MALLDSVEPLLEHWQTILIASVILLLVYFRWIAPYQMLRAVYPKGPTPLPMIGHLVDILKHKGKIHLQMDEYYKKYGQVYAMLIFGDIPCIVIGDPEMIKEILVKESGSFYDRPVSKLSISVYYLILYLKTIAPSPVLITVANCLLTRLFPYVVINMAVLLDF